MRPTQAYWLVICGLVQAALCGPGLSTAQAVPAETSPAPTSAEPDPLLRRVWPIDQLDRRLQDAAAKDRWQPFRVNLAPAQWIWLPSQRTLPNSFVLFRRELHLDAAPRRAAGWITADSRYRLTVNGEVVQWGPAPCDPRQLDVDPVDFTRQLRLGRNVIGVEVLYYGVGDGTWAAGKPGLLFRAGIETADGRIQQIVSDTAWQTVVDRAHRPGQPKRWFLRALQEEFDARLHPYGWDTPDGSPDAHWAAAAVLGCPADKPISCGSYAGGDSIDQANPAVSALRLRQIPPTRESLVAAARLADSGRVEWLREPLDWFEFRMPDSFRLKLEPLAAPRGEGRWELPATGDPGQAGAGPGQAPAVPGSAGSPGVPTPSPAGSPPSPTEAAPVQAGVASVQGVWATFEFPEQVVGWPYFTIEAPAGTIIELMCQESHDPQKTLWLDTQFFAWTRFVCREGVNHFQTYDYESLRWLQLHVRHASRPVTVSQVGVRRRQFAWPQTPQIHCSDAALQRLFEAAVNTVRNSAIETVVDGMARERQQYSGDGGHQLLALRYAFGETRICRRFLRTFSEGLTPEGYFLDCWPAFDRLARVAQKQVDGAYWGPLLDHGIGFNFDCWNHYLETGEREAVVEPYPRLVRFAEYLRSLRGPDGLLPVEGLGVPTVWMDHQAYRRQRHKQCAFNLYAAAMLRHALAPLAEGSGEPERAAQYRQWSDEILAAAVRRFWSAQHGLFVNNLPWLDEEQQLRLCDRSLATAILFDQCPEGNTTAAARALAESPPPLGLSYPCNAGWRYWALAKLGRADVVLRELRQRWAPMRSVVENNTLQEDWTAPSDSTAQWSHCAVVPLYVLFQDIAGIRPTAPGFTRCQIRPQLGDLGNLDITAYTVRGPIRFVAEARGDGHQVQLTLPADCEAELLALPGVTGAGEPLAPDHALGLKRFRLQAGQTNTLRIPRSGGS